MKKIIRRIVAWIITISLCVFSCWGLYIFFLEPPFPKTSGITSVWVEKMFHSPTCVLPCWENITPGVTLLNEGPNLLEQVPGVEITHAFYRQGEDNWTTEWLMDSGSNTKDMGWANLPSTDEIIYNLILSLDGESYMPVEDFIDVYGQPEYLQVYHCDGTLCMFRLVYPDIGTMIELVLPGRGLFPWQQERSHIEKNSDVEAIILFPKGMDYFYFSYLGYRAPFGSPLVKWQGYGVYDYQGNFNP